jgi:general secretion pathway protein D
LAPTRALVGVLLIIGTWSIAPMLLSGCESSRRHPTYTAVPPTQNAATPVSGSEPAQLGPFGSDTLTSEVAEGTTPQAPIVDRGTGMTIGQRPLTSFETEPDGSITLNFVNTDIREVISAILGDALKVSYAIDPRVQGTVTVRTSQPLPAASAIPVLEDILSMSGAALMKTGDTYKIVPLEGASAGFRTEPGYGIHVIPLQFASAAAMGSLLEPYVPPGRVLRTDTGRNVLLFAGTNREARELEELVEIFDVDWMTGMSFAIFPLRSSEAKTVAQELDRVFGQDLESEVAGIVQFVPIERQNAILVITAQPSYLDKAATWIERLDQGQEGVQQRAYVYWVQNGNAKDLAAVLNDVFGGEQRQLETRVSLAPGLSPVEISNYPDALRRPAAPPPMPVPPVAPVEPPPGPGPDAAVPMEPLVSTSAALGAEEGIPLDTQASARIVADERNNALLIMATPAQYRAILAAVRQLDVVPLQVLIEATIAEVTLNDQLRYGLQWFFNFGNSTITFSQVASGLVNPVFPAFNYIFQSNDARVVLSALTSVTDVRIISAPHLLVLDNEQARLQVGDQVPIVTQQATSVIDPDAPLVNTVEYRDTGVILEIIPHVNSSGLVILDIIQEVSDVAETVTSGIDSPTIQQRQVASTVVVQTGETVALGGLIRDRHTEGETGIPVLSEIPILGNLFKTTTNTDDRTELLILLTPRVVRNANDARVLTEELRRRIPSVTILEQRLAPKLPEIPNP